MFHVEQQQVHIKTKDFLVSTEEFFIVKTPVSGLLKTLPSPSKNNIQKYYNSDKYTSHYSEDITAFNYIYRMSRKLNFFFKRRHVNLHSCRSLLDFGSGDGDFIHNISKSNVSVFGVEPILTTNKTNVYKKLSTLQKEGLHFSTITAWHSLEHTQKINDTSQALVDLLEEKGRLIIAVPNYESYDALFYKSFWAGYDTPRHLWHLNQHAVVNLFTKRGLTFCYSSPMLLDAFYVSYLSELNKKSRLPILKAFFIALFSNVKAIFTNQYSSNLFVFEKTNKCV
ncbi:MAG: methyltransferase [Bacteroidetes bacterium MED-G13]|nr:MAG: methyltransferase [Bacteroidetes bacterium MED-G13]|tara:strand:- start:1899 stop:2744 length:846 start_codon:yes stop_codon:yes gene_type:complete